MHRTHLAIRQGRSPRTTLPNCNETSSGQSIMLTFESAPLERAGIRTFSRGCNLKLPGEAEVGRIHSMPSSCGAQL